MAKVDVSAERMRKLKLARWRARTDLQWLCNAILGYKDVSREVHGPVIDRLQKFPRPTDEQMEANDQFVNGRWIYTPLVPMLDLEGKRRLLLLDFRGGLKCACDNTEVRTNTGVYKRASEVKVGDVLYGIEEETFDPREVTITGIEEQSPQQAYRIKFRSGREVEVSHEHPLKTIDGWVNAEDVKPGDLIASLGEAPEPTNAQDLPEAEILGWYIGDGSFDNSVVTNQDPELRKKIIVAAEKAGGTAHESFPKDRCPCVRTQGLRDLFRLHGVQETTSGNKFVPEAVFRASDKSVRDFLYAYLMCDGTLKRGGISYTTKSPQLAKDIQRLFLRFGVHVTIRPITLRTGPYAGNVYWFGYIQSSAQVKKVLALFPWDKKHSWSGESTFSNPNNDLVPKPWRKLYPKYFFARGTKPEWLVKKWGRWDGQRIVGKSLSTYRGRKEYLYDLGVALNDKRLQNLGSSKINWEEVSEVVDLGLQRTWAIETDNHTYAIDDVVTHNTTTNAISHTIQWIINYPDIAVAILQANIDKAADIISEIKNHFTKNPRFRELFPEHCPDAKKVESFGTQLEFTTRARGAAVTRKEPTVRGASIEKGLAGSHFDLMKYSDIVDENNSNNAEICRSIFKKFVLSQNLLVSPIFWIDVEGTRYDEKDTYGEIIRGQQLVPEEQREWNIFVRGIFVKDTGGRERKYTYEEVKLPDLKDSKGFPISVWPERFPISGVMAEYVMEPYLVSCTPGWGKILMSNWQEKPISEVVVGDEVIGFEEEPRPGKVCGLIRSKVLATGSEIGKVFKYTTNKGGVFYSTADHLWFCGRKEKKREYYKTPKIGRKMVRVYRPIENKDPILWAYLGGIIDGEGHFAKNGSNITICQSVTKNPAVSNKIQETLDTLGIKHNPHPRYETQADGSVNKTVLWDLQGGRNLRLSVMLNCPHLGKRDQAEAQLWNLASRVGHQDGPTERIVSQVCVGEMPVYWLQTTSGNYVSQQYASKNCQKFNFPNHAAGGQTVFPVDSKYPAWKSRLDFTQRVLVDHYEIRVDTAETINERSNYSVITVGAWDSAGRLYIVDIRRGKWLAAELIAQVVAAFIQYRDRSRNGFVRVAIEETAYVRGLLLGFNQYMQQRGVHIPLETFKTDNTKSKTEKIVKTLQYPYMTKQLIFLDDLKEKDALIKELEGMPKPLTDDILDTLAAFYTGKEWLGRLNARPEPGNADQLLSNTLNPDLATKRRQLEFARMLGFSHNLENGFDNGPAMDPDLARTGGL